MSDKTEICKEKFLYYARENIKRPGIEELLDWLEHESDFFEAPASTKYHSAYAGGLCEHSVNVYERLKKLYAAEKGAALTDEEEEKIALVALFHDLCKTNMYVVDYGDHLASYGICQWNDDRLKALEDFCLDYSADITDLYVQLMYFSHDITTNFPTLEEYLRELPDSDYGARCAAQVICKQYEVPTDLEAEVPTLIR